MTCNSSRQQLLVSDARYMRDLIKQARARWAVMPEYFKRDTVRRLEDGAAQAAAEVRGS